SSAFNSLKPPRCLRPEKQKNSQSVQQNREFLTPISRWLPLIGSSTKNESRSGPTLTSTRRSATAPQETRGLDAAEEVLRLAEGQIELVSGRARLPTRGIRRNGRCRSSSKSPSMRSTTKCPVER